MNSFTGSLCVSAGLLLAVHSPVKAATIMVFAASSLTDALKAVAADYEKTSGDKIVFNFAASGPLARQIEEGVPADIFFAADEARADALQKKGLLVNTTRVSRLGNTLAIVTLPEVAVVHAAQDLTNAAVKRVAVGDVRTVPAGTYAKAFLEKRALWANIAPKTIPCESVRAVLAAVESGNVDAGIVYATDAAISKKVKVAFQLPAQEGPKIVYPLALVKSAPEPVAAKKFLDYLNSESAARLFRQAGFVVLETEEVK